MYCTRCGTYNSGKGLYCKKCGSSLVLEALEEDYSTKDNTKINTNNKTINKTINKEKNKTINKNITKERKDNNKNKDKEVNNSVEREIIHKTSAFQKFMIFLLIMLVLILGGCLVALGLYIFQDKTVEVPNVIGMDKDQAVLLLENNNLRVKVKEEEVDTESDNNKVLDCNKDEGEFVLKNSKIVLTVGKYNVQRLDNYIGKKLDDIKDKINIKYEVNEIESEKEEGIIISQKPSSGSEYDDNTTITFNVSKEKESPVEE